MIKYFGGHVEMTGLGFAGLPVDERIETDEHLASVFAETRSFAHIMDEAGYDTLWLAEHHFQREGFGCISNIPMVDLWTAGSGVRICEIQDQLPGLERIAVQGGALGIPPCAIRRDLEWFGRDVLPRFKNTRQENE